MRARGKARESTPRTTHDQSVASADSEWGRRLPFETADRTANGQAAALLGYVELVVLAVDGLIGGETRLQETFVC
jgi:hypothetical protein